MRILLIKVLSIDPRKHDENTRFEFIIPCSGFDIPTAPRVPNNEITNGKGLKSFVSGVSFYYYNDFLADCQPDIFYN